LKKCSYLFISLCKFKCPCVSAKPIMSKSESRTISEAVVAIPYIVDSVEGTSEEAGTFNSTRKSFIDIPTIRYEAALKAAKGTKVGDSLDTAGESIRKLIQKMDRYVLPPQFDFLNNESVGPIVMYIFEFNYTFDKDDLSYIWQNISPRNSKKITFLFF